ncbi:hypothetical protein [Leeia speluncae]|nr:hypothetical protein [Leeia speluncae]
MHNAKYKAQTKAMTKKMPKAILLAAGICSALYILLISQYGH